MDLNDDCPNCGAIGAIKGAHCQYCRSTRDPLYDRAVEVVLTTGRPSISLVQRSLHIGYNQAARLLEDMEKAGLVSKMSNGGNREILC